MSLILPGDKEFNKDPQRAYELAHERADTDFDAQSIHHTIGPKPTQAAAGNHLHDDRYEQKEEFHKYDVTDLLLAPASSYFSSNSRLTRSGDTVDIYIDTTCTIAAAGGAGFSFIPPEHRPSNPLNRYIAVCDSATGNLIPAYVWSGGQLAHIFSRSVGQGTLGHVSYVAVHP